MGTPTIEWVREGVGFTPDAAASFRRAEAALGRRIDVNSTYRDYQKQLAMYEAWNRYVKSGYQQSLYPGHSRAVHPDQSVHCQGRALDSDDWTRPGFIAFMADHGWIRTAAGDPTERHHFEYQWQRDTHRHEGIPTGGETKPLPDPTQKTGDIVMRTIYNTDGVDAPDADVTKRRRALVGELTFQPLGVYAAKQEYKLWGNPENVDGEEWKAIKARVNSRRTTAGLPTIN